MMPGYTDAGGSVQALQSAGLAPFQPRILASVLRRSAPLQA